MIGGGNCDKEAAWQGSPDHRYCCGQGRATALAFSREGAKVVECDLKKEPALETVAIVRAGGEKPFTDCLLIRRIGTAEDIAAVAVYLASDEASYVTGINLPVDGGWTASGGLGQPHPDIAGLFAAAMQELDKMSP